MILVASPAMGFCAAAAAGPAARGALPAYRARALLPAPPAAGAARPPAAPAPRAGPRPRRVLGLAAMIWEVSGVVGSGDATDLVEGLVDVHVDSYEGDVGVKRERLVVKGQGGGGTKKLGDADAGAVANSSGLPRGMDQCGTWQLPLPRHGSVASRALRRREGPGRSANAMQSVDWALDSPSSLLYLSQGPFHYVERGRNRTTAPDERVRQAADNGQSMAIPRPRPHVTYSTFNSPIRTLLIHGDSDRWARLSDPLNISATCPLSTRTKCQRMIVVVR